MRRKSHDAGQFRLFRHRGRREGSCRSIPVNDMNTQLNEIFFHELFRQKIPGGKLMPANSYYTWGGIRRYRSYLFSQ